MTPSATDSGTKTPSTKDAGATTHGDLVELSLANFREHRDTAARWLAVEVLLSDEPILEDENLASALHALQDRLETQARARYGVG